MSGRMLARGSLLVWLALSTASCADTSDPAENQADAAAQPSAQSDAGVAGDGGNSGDIDAAVDAAVASGGDAARSATLAACVERPGALPSAPMGALPCALLPPGFSR